MNSSPIGSDNTPLPPAGKAPLPINIRAAGFCMVVMAILTFLLGAVVPEAGFHATSGIFDLILGAMLWSGNRSGLVFTKFRTWVGLLIGTPMMLATGGAPDAIGQVLWCTGMLALLAEKPGKPRIIFGGLLMVSNLTLVTLGAVALHFGMGPLNALAYQGKTQPLPAGGLIKTKDSSLSLKVTRPGWEQMKADEVKVQNDLFDFWVVDPRADWHLAVLPETVEDPIALEAYRDAVVSIMADSKVVSQEKHRLGQLVHFHEAKDSVEIERLVLLVVRPKEVYQVHAWCQTSQFGAAEPEFRKMLDTLEVP